MRDFLLSGVRDRSRDKLVAWDMVCKPNEEGGLFLVTWCLVRKRLWRFSATFINMMVGMFMWRKHCFCQSLEVHLKGLSFPSTNKLQGSFGRQGFLEGHWGDSRDTPFAIAFSRLYSLPSFHNLPMYHVYTFDGVSVTWNFHFVRHIDWRYLDELTGFIHLLDSLHYSVK